VRTCRASIAGLRKGIWVTTVVRRIELVASAMAASDVHDSNHGTAGFVQSTKWSASAATSKPNASSRTARAFSSAQPTFGRSRTWKRSG
jgi:hypothetical protein